MVMVDLFRPYMSEHASNRVADLLKYRPDGRMFIGQGAMVTQFEQALKSTLDSPQDVLSVNSGTSALDLAMYIAGVGPGKTVIATPMTCSASNSPIITKFARVIWADIDPKTGLISPESVVDRVQWCARHLGQAPAAIIAVDWGGRLCDYPALIEAAQVEMFGREWQVPIIQDAAHAFTAYGENGVTGARSGADFICYSFQAIKHLTTVDGGALICKTQENTDRARLLRWYGLDRNLGDSFRCSQDIQEPGFKYHMNDLAATIGLANINDVDDIVSKHRANARWYHHHLAEVDGHAISLPAPDEGSAWWLYTLLVGNRDAFIEFMRERGIECSQVHRRNDAHPGFIRRTYGHMPLPGTDYFADHEVAIPVGWWLNDQELRRVADAILEWNDSRTQVTA
jgi:dTDP-4-amino-4,6-dideoxygalactose transaminase